MPIPDRPVDEQDLARRAVAGDRRAFAELYDLHVGAVYRYAFFRVRTAAEAEDVTSEVFQRAL
ncbi:MAG: RNA polymerase subunit sigma-70, partial [Chloroflexi bacterium]